jgi:hypothetical protein
LLQGLTLLLPLLGGGQGQLDAGRFQGG